MSSRPSCAAWLATAVLYAALVRAYQAQVLALCLRMTGDREDAAGAAQ